LILPLLAAWSFLDEVAKLGWKFRVVMAEWPPLCLRFCRIVKQGSLGKELAK